MKSARLAAFYLILDRQPTPEYSNEINGTVASHLVREICAVTRPRVHRFRHFIHRTRRFRQPKRILARRARLALQGARPRPSCSSRWWCQQRSSQFSRLVAPPRDQGTFVMDLTPAGWSITARSNATAIAGDQRVPQCLRDHTGRAADIEGLAAALGEDAGNAGVAREPFDRRHRQATDVFGVGADRSHETRGVGRAQDLDVGHQRDVGLVRLPGPWAYLARPTFTSSTRASARCWGRVRGCLRPSSDHESKAVDKNSVAPGSSVPLSAPILPRVDDKYTSRRSNCSFARAGAAIAVDASVTCCTIWRSSTGVGLRASSTNGASRSAVSRRAARANTSTGSGRSPRPRTPP